MNNVTINKPIGKLLLNLFFAITVFSVQAQKNPIKQSIIYNKGLTKTKGSGLDLKKKISDYEKISSKIQIVRDRWGVPHIYAETDQQCAFGLMYAQCEDDFWQVEETFVRQLGKAAELYGSAELINDAEVALFQCVQRAREAYKNATDKVRALCASAADGINFYISTNPHTKPRLITHYEPWYFLLPSPAYASSHGITGNEMKGILKSTHLQSNQEGELNFLVNTEISGSNALAISSKKTKDASSVLVINPHVNFFGLGQRYEAHLISKEGLNVSGFAILGTFYIWSGFTDKTAWAHTNTGSDYQDVYLEKPNPIDSTEYQYGNKFKKFISWQDTLAYKNGEKLSFKVFSFRKSHHGPVVAKRESLWVTIRSAVDEDPAKYILQSYVMSKAKSLKEFKTAMAICQLTTNTMYADKDGNIAYWHGNKIPKRNPVFDWKQPVHGSNPETEWRGYHTVDEIIHYVNPASGFLQNCNSTPFLAAGEMSKLDKSIFPSYLAYDEQNLRSQELLLQLTSKDRFSSEDVEEVITSKNLPVMRNWLNQIIADYEMESVKRPEIKESLAIVIDTLRKWDKRYSLQSTATTIAFAWHSQLLSWLGKEVRKGNAVFSTFNNDKQLRTPPGVATDLLLKAIKDDLIAGYGTPFIEWQFVCRLQRAHTSGDEKFDDKKFSIPVNAAPAIMGSLFSFNPRFTAANKRGYGISGNTYTAVVSFGKKMKAKSIMPFGQSSDSSSRHYFDQAPLYAAGKFKEAYYYRYDVFKNAEEIYHPGRRDKKLNIQTAYKRINRRN